MKLINLSILCLVMAGCSPMKYEATKLVTPVRQSVTKAQVKVESAQVRAKNATEALARLKALLDLSTKPEEFSLLRTVETELVALTVDLTTVAEELRTTQLKVDALESTAGTIIAERERALAEKAILERRYDKLKFGLCTLAAAGALYLLLQFKSILAFAGPYGWIAFVVGPAVVFALMWRAIDWAL